MRARLIVFAGFVAVLLGVWQAAEHLWSLELLVAEEAALRSWVAARPVLSFVVAIGLYTVLSVIPGTSGKSVVCGWLLGLWRGLPVVLGGLTAAAVLGFLLSRFLFREAVHDRFGAQIDRLDRALETDGPLYLLTLRMLHLPYTLLNYACGAANLSTWTFAWTTCVGLVPGTLAMTAAGASLPSLAELAENGPVALLDPVPLTLVAISGAIPWSVRSLYRVLRRNTGRVGGLRPFDAGGAG